jgi:hypothetical protein
LKRGQTIISHIGEGTRTSKEHSGVGKVPGREKFQGSCWRRSARFHAELLENVFEVFMNGPRTQAEDDADIGIGLALCYPKQYFGLARRKSEPLQLEAPRSDRLDQRRLTPTAAKIFPKSLLPWPVDSFVSSGSDERTASRGAENENKRHSDGRKMKMNTKANFLAAAISLATIGHSFCQEPAVPSKTDSVNLEIKIQGNTISGITHGKDLHVAVGQTGTILTSPDGVTWTRQNSRTSQYLRSIAFGKGVFVAVGSSGTVLVSTNGVDWTDRSSQKYPCFRGIAYGNGVFVEVGANGVIATSPDGVTWTQRSSGVTAFLRGISYGNDTFAAVGENGTILTSTNGASWTKRDCGTTRTLKSIAFPNGTFVAADCAGTLLSSRDGNVWSSQTPEK